jgi:spoIIIJ-associated protein
VPVDNERVLEGGDPQPPAAGFAASGENDAEVAPREDRPAAPADDTPFVEDGRADVALDFTIDVLAAMGMDCTVDLLENDEEDPPEDIRLEIEGKDAGRIIGKKGQTLSALQFLANRVVNRPGKHRRHVIVDAEGYRARREDTLTSMARRLGKQAVDEGKIITFEPMNPQDRRVVHLALAKFPGVVTKSDGEGEARRVQIIPVRR